MNLYSVFQRHSRDGKTHFEHIQTFMFKDDAQQELDWRRENDEGTFILLHHTVYFKKDPQ